MWLFKQRVINQGSYQPVTVEIRPVDPSLEQLCADIESRPQGYKNDGLRIVNRTDDALWISPYLGQNCVTDDPDVLDTHCVQEACKAFEEYQRTRRMTDVAARINAVRNLNIPIDQQQANLSRAQAGLSELCGHPSSSIAFLRDQVQAVLIPVLAGTPKIVPVARQWPDKAGQMHATREQARTANREMRTGAGS